MRPEVHQPILGMTINAPEALLAGKLDAGANRLKSEPGLAILGSYRQSLELAEIREKSCANASRRLVAHVTDQMGCAEVVAIELLPVRAILIAHEHARPDCDDLHHVRERARDPHADLARMIVCGREAGLCGGIDGNVLGHDSAPQAAKARSGARLHIRT